MTLDTFERGLLAELRGHVAERAAAPHPPAPRKTRRRWRWAAVPVAAAGAAIAVGVALMQPTAAYAVTESDGEVLVTIHRLDDAEGLERALAEHGVEAEVDYSAEPITPPAGSGPVPDPGVPGTRTGGKGLVTGPDTGPDTGGDTGPDTGGESAWTPASGGPVLVSSLSEDAFTLRLDPDTIPDDMVLRITTSGSLDRGVSGLQVVFVPAG